MVSREEIKKIVIHRLAAELRASEESISEEMELKADLDVDSMTLISLGLLLEDEPELDGQAFNEDELASIVKVGDIINMIESGLLEIRNA